MRGGSCTPLLQTVYVLEKQASMNLQDAFSQPRLFPFICPRVKGDNLAICCSERCLCQPGLCQIRQDDLFIFAREMVK